MDRLRRGDKITLTMPYGRFTYRVEGLRVVLPQNTGVLKHVRVLEEANLVTTEKKGRTRECRLGPDQMDDVTAWIERYRTRWERRLDRLEALVDKRKGETT